jgi:hypothetical protein
MGILSVAAERSIEENLFPNGGSSGEVVVNEF